MRKARLHLLSAFLVLAAAFMLASPVDAKTTTSTTAPAASSPAATTVPAPAATSSTTDTSATDSGAPAPATTPTPPPKAAKGGPLRPKLIDADDISTSGMAKGSIDVYVSLTNKGKFDDALVGADTPISDTVELITTTNKKEAAGAFHVDLPLDKTVKLAAGDKFIRISGIEASLKDGQHFPLTLHFRSAPNVTTDVTVHKKSGLFGF